MCMGGGGGRCDESLKQQVRLDLRTLQDNLINIERGFEDVGEKLRKSGEKGRDFS